MTCNDVPKHSNRT